MDIYAIYDLECKNSCFHKNNIEKIFNNRIFIKEEKFKLVNKIMLKYSIKYPDINFKLISKMVDDDTIIKIYYQNGCKQFAKRKKVLKFLSLNNL